MVTLLCKWVAERQCVNTAFLMREPPMIHQVETSPSGTFEKCRRTLRMSVGRGKPEVAGRSSKRPFLTQRGHLGPPAQSLKQGVRDALLETLVELGLTNNWQHMIDKKPPLLRPKPSL